MRIATFNINGIKARLQALPEWLDEAQPDVAMLQEIKSLDDAFPGEVFEDRGYNVETHGQKGFNGVAILSKPPLEDVTRGLPGDDTDDQARYIEATVIHRRSVFAGSTCPMAIRHPVRNTITSLPGWRGSRRAPRRCWPRRRPS